MDQRTKNKIDRIVLSDGEHYGEGPPEEYDDGWEESQLPSAITSQVILDLKQRDRDGFKKYGGYLEDNLSINPIQEAYEEALDLCHYLKLANNQISDLKWQAEILTRDLAIARLEKENLEKESLEKENLEKERQRKEHPRRVKS